MTTPDADSLRKVSLFADLSADDLATLATWLDTAEYPAGRPMLREDDSGYAFFILDDGTAHAEHNGQVLEVLEPGAVFGEMAFFAADGHRTATIIPQTPVRVFTMFGTRFREMQQQMPNVANGLEAIIRERAERSRAADQ